MRIVRPYGSSRTKESEKGFRRFLVEKSADRAEHDIPAFAHTHDALIIAQWISTVDKIARKPAGRKKPTPEQRAFRERLGEACWQRLTQGGHLPGAKGDQSEFLKNLWWFKIHPYGQGTEEPRPMPGGRTPPAPKTEGRWYDVFAGDYKPDQADVSEIARRVEAHLYESEYRLGSDVPPRRRGKIESRSQSISTNVLGISKDPAARPAAWTAQDIDTYRMQGDPAKVIYEAAQALEVKEQRMSHAIAGEKLFRHWGKVFRVPGTGEPMSVEQARTIHPGMFALHVELKQCYSRLLKRTRKDTRDHRKRHPGGRKISALLPRNLEVAIRLSQTLNGNAVLGHLVRLGRVIHYTASDGNADQPAAIRDNWPEHVDGGRFWTSEGQAEIKRAEAFVRIWRHALVQAGLTLKDWVSMQEPFRGDILGGGGQLDQAVQPDRFERGHFDRKLLLLFGNRVRLFNLNTVDDCLGLLRGLIDGAANLRHAVFHFKGRGQLLKNMENLSKRFSAPIKETARRLWQEDIADRTERLKAVLRGSHVERLLTPEQVVQIFALLSQETIAELPLPRFSRVLNRAENAWSMDKGMRLPAPVNRRVLEAPARLCQYTVLKLTYERPFRSWLKNQDAETIAGWIERAVARATEAARALNARGDEIARKVITARAADLPKPSPGSDIRDFFYELSAASASEMRIQRGYESDADNARKQAEYIEHLLCDVVILSFSAFLSEQRLIWALDIDPDQSLPEHSACSLDLLQSPLHDPHIEDWELVLYLILHLLPVETVGRLLHQLFKWEITAGRDSGMTPEDKAHLRQLITTLTLHLDMHDAKFDGATALVGCDDFRELFESERGFERVFPRDWNSETERHVPRRGLREIMRFGHMPLLRAITRARKIDDSTIDRVFALEVSDGTSSQIAVLQKKREDLHEKWVKAKHLGAADLREYCEALARISQHRRDSGFVNLVDHVRAHRLTMSVLGRLVDYVGLFERDLYFVTLALMYQAGLRPNALFNARGFEFLANGQIIFALRQLDQNPGPAGNQLLRALARYFEKVWSRNNPTTGIRNDLAHVNMLQGNAPAPRLTHWINQTRLVMAYDRKLKNAVSKSVIELVAREGIELDLQMQVDGSAHILTNAELSSRSATHLGKTRLTLAGKEQSRRVPLTETLHSAGYIAMCAEAFGGRVRRRFSIVENLPNINWEASTERDPRDRAGQDHPRRPHKDRPNWRPTT